MRLILKSFLLITINVFPFVTYSQIKEIMQDKNLSKKIEKSMIYPDELLHNKKSLLLKLECVRTDSSFSIRPMNYIPIELYTFFDNNIKSLKETLKQNYLSDSLIIKLIYIHCDEYFTQLPTENFTSFYIKKDSEILFKELESITFLGFGPKIKSIQQR